MRNPLLGEKWPKHGILYVNFDGGKNVIFNLLYRKSGWMDVHQETVHQVLVNREFCDWINLKVKCFHFFFLGICIFIFFKGHFLVKKKELWKKVNFEIFVRVFLTGVKKTLTEIAWISKDSNFNKNLWWSKRLKKQNLQVEFQYSKAKKQFPISYLLHFNRFQFKQNPKLKVNF